MNNVSITTYSGQKVNPFRMTPGSIAIEDIAHALSQICRWNGHSKYFYSVAQHSVYVAEFLKHKKFEPEIILAGLLHDAAEAYLGDMARPYKDLFPAFCKAEDALLDVIFKKYCIDQTFDIMGPVETADDMLNHTEEFVLIENGLVWPEGVGAPVPMQIEHWPAEKAERVFLELFYQVYEKHELSIM